MADGDETLYYRNQTNTTETSGEDCVGVETAIIIGKMEGSHRDKYIVSGFLYAVHSKSMQ